MLGAHSLSEPEETKQTFDILELYNHPDFSMSNYDNDIALIKVSVYLVSIIQTVIGTVFQNLNCYVVLFLEISQQQNSIL